MSTMIIGAVCLFGAFLYANADPELINAQVIFRHGDRTPMFFSKSNPYTNDDWKAPPGSLTREGVQQQYKTGLKLKSRYIDKYRLVSKDYNPYEVLVRAAMDDRCMMSATANLAGFYSGSETLEGWPFNWMPIPVHTGSFPDRVFEPGQACPLLKAIRAVKEEHETFKEFALEHESLLDEFVQNTGESWKLMREINGFLDTQICRLAHNLSLPDWLTPEKLMEGRMATNRHYDYIWGHNLDGNSDDKIVRLRAGPIMEVLTSNFTEASKYKYYVYSAHDSSLLAIMSALGKNTQYEILGNHWPQYASTIVFELWKMDEGDLRVKMLFSANADDKFHDFSSAIDGCPEREMCPAKTIIARTRKYIPKNIEMECALKTKTKASMHKEKLESS
ncbi:unnamed protein product, partial [Mesorhabditis spiculigera]